MNISFPAVPSNAPVIGECFKVPALRYSVPTITFCLVMDVMGDGDDTALVDAWLLTYSPTQYGTKYTLERTLLPLDSERLANKWGTSQEEVMFHWYEARSEMTRLKMEADFTAMKQQHANERFDALADIIWAAI